MRRGLPILGHRLELVRPQSIQRPWRRGPVKAVSQRTGGVPGILAKKSARPRAHPPEATHVQPEWRHRSQVRVPLERPEETRRRLEPSLKRR